MVRRGWGWTVWIGNDNFAKSEKSWTKGRAHWRPKRANKNSGKKDIGDEKSW